MFAPPRWLMAMAVLLCVLFITSGDASSSRCRDVQQTLSTWQLRGGGFHLDLEVFYALHMNRINVTITLPPSFFVDVAEAEQLYRMEHHHHDGSTHDATSLATDVRVWSDLPVDIEAPVFKVPQVPNHVYMSWSVHHTSSNTASLTTTTTREGRGGYGVLVMPIHTRYEELDVRSPFSVARFWSPAATKWNSVQRCLENITVSGTAMEVCGDERIITLPTSNDASGRCTRIPVGSLGDLPIVYWWLMSMLVFGAVIVVVMI